MHWPVVIALLALVATAPLAHSQDIGIAVERRLAEEAMLAVGDTVRVAADTGAGVRATVRAIYDPTPDPATIMRRDFHVRFELADFAALLGQPDRVDRFGVVLQPGVDPDTAAARLDRTAFGFSVFSSERIAAGSSTTFLVVSRFHRAIAVISIVASAIFLLCLMLLKVEERRADVAVLRLTGISRRTVFISLMIEAAVIALVGSALGVLMASGASALTNWHYQRAFETSLQFSMMTGSTIAFAVALSVTLGIVAGAAAAWRLVGTPPMVLWRRG